MTAGFLRSHAKYLVILAAGYIVLSVLLAPSGFNATDTVDTYSYTRVSKALLYGGKVDLSVRPPGYPLFLLPLQYFESRSLIWVMHVMVALLAAFLYFDLLVRYVFPRPRTAIIAVFLTGAPFEVIVWQGQLMPEALLIPFLMIWVWIDLNQQAQGRRISWYFSLACLADLILMFIKPAFLFGPYSSRLCAWGLAC
jgi:hypothetical protein